MGFRIPHVVRPLDRRRDSVRYGSQGLAYCCQMTVGTTVVRDNDPGSVHLPNFLVYGEGDTRENTSSVNAQTGIVLHRWPDSCRRYRVCNCRKHIFGGGSLDACSMCLSGKRRREPAIMRSQSSTSRNHHILTKMICEKSAVGKSPKDTRELYT